MRRIRAESKTYRVARRAAVLFPSRLAEMLLAERGRSRNPPPNLTSAFNIAAFNLGSAGGAYLEGLVLDS
jgi:predicted MFS family arabinose efflux permease